MLALRRCRLSANLSPTTSNCLSKLRKNVWMSRRSARVRSFGPPRCWCRCGNSNQRPSTYAFGSCRVVFARLLARVDIDGAAWTTGRGVQRTPFCERLCPVVTNKLMREENLVPRRGIRTSTHRMTSGWIVLCRREVRWCRGEDSNLRPTHYECVALPAELPRQGFYINTFFVF
jgi:hypothetical protein